MLLEDFLDRGLSESSNLAALARAEVSGVQRQASRSRSLRHDQSNAESALIKKFGVNPTQFLEL
jgi:hypothetical protein